MTFSNCVDYDLCENCESVYGVHDPNHVFLKLRKPIKLRRKTPMMRNILYKMYQLPSESEETPAKAEETPAKADLDVEDVVDPSAENSENRTRYKLER